MCGDELIMNRYYIFGAHSRAQTTAVYLQRIHPEWKFLGFLFNDDEKNSLELMGRPVIDVRTAEQLDTSARVYLGIRGVGFSHAIKALQVVGFEDVEPVDVELDRNLRMQYMKMEFANQNREFLLLDSLPASGECVNVQIGIAHALKDAKLNDLPALAPYESYVQAGTAIDCELAKDCYFHDNDGNTISDKNRQFCELTVLYWLWKNCDADWIGLEHYRRRFILPNDWKKRLNGIDVILPVPLYVYPSLEENFLMRHEKVVWDNLMQILEKGDKDFGTIAKDFFSKQGCYSPCNMLIARREVLNSLSNWLFPILFELEKRVGVLADSYQNRYPGFVAERLISLYFYVNRDQYRVTYAEKGFLK